MVPCGRRRPPGGVSPLATIAVLVALPLLSSTWAWDPGSKAAEPGPVAGCGTLQGHPIMCKAGCCSAGGVCGGSVSACGPGCQQSFG
jgi:hypothetical protein